MSRSDEQRAQAERQHMIDTAPPGGEVIILADMPFADVKAIFAADGSFNVNPNRTLTAAAPEPITPEQPEGGKP